MLAGDSVDLSVVRQALSAHASSANSATDVSNRARAELRDALASRWIHNVLLASVTGVCTQWATLLGADGILLSASLRCTVMDSTESMTRLVRHDLPLVGALRTDDHISTRHSLLP